jgi:ABC-type multidrug transport system fused ATPase/permease subunit
MNPVKAPSKWRMTADVARRAHLLTPRVVAALTGYYVVTPLISIVDGLSWLMLVNVFSSRAGLQASGGPLSLLSWMPARLTADSRSQLTTVAALFLLKAGLTAALYAFEGIGQANARRALQEYCLASVLRGRWDFLRQGSVGQWVGAATEESTNFAYYLTMGARTLYALGSFCVLAGMAVLVNPKLSLVMLVLMMPAGVMLRFLYRRHSALSSRMAEERQRFSADATERLSGLFQIKAFGDLAPHLRAGAAAQKDLTRVEILVAYSNGLINGFTPLLLPILLVGFSVWTAWHDQSVSDQLHVLGSVGILGFRAASQLSILVSSYGSFAAASGCVAPVHRLCSIPEEPLRELLPEKLAAVELKDVGYAVDGRSILQGKTLSLGAGKLFLIVGPSGGGKSTLANLISGLYEPSAGGIEYVGASGRRYDSRRYRAKIGYVTQDVFLFRGTVRKNLDPWNKLGDNELRRCLEQAGAAGFVDRIGGLDAEVAEAGRSLSGGERRRLAIAATLAQQADCLVLDEVTNGLDDAAKRSLVDTIAALSRDALVIAISHDLAAFEKIDTAVHALPPRPS